MIALALILALLAIFTTPALPYATSWGPWPSNIFMLLLIILLFVIWIGAVPCSRTIF